MARKCAVNKTLQEYWATWRTARKHYYVLQAKLAQVKLQVDIAMKTKSGSAAFNGAGGF